ncbi:MAG TPA: hypothetical protein VF736_09100 [Pyrinomonadaceae bacterium]|jgi:hypothetical protein
MTAAAKSPRAKARGYRAEECARAARRGAEFMLGFARKPGHFKEWGSDFLYYFQVLANTAADPLFRRWARAEGAELARRWRRLNPEVPADADAGAVYDLAYGSLHADKLGVRDPSMRAPLRAAARRFCAADFVWFDPAAEPPPADVPRQCRCGLWNERGRRTCAGCRRRLSTMSRYRVWYNALIRTYMMARYGLSLGTGYADVLRRADALRPYPSDPSDPDFYDAAYAVTHVVYTLNDYDVYRLRPAWLPDEFEFLRAHADGAVAAGDAEMVGEFLECLKCFGAGPRSPLVRRGTDFLLASQNEDGSWGDTDTDNTYVNYHTTLTASGGLTEIRWRGEGLTFPEVMPLLGRRAGRKKARG